jgi:hypothetical protein
MHFGHFKAGCTNDIITNFEATMANIPLLSRYSPKRWQKAVDCMLLKREGNYQVDKLRTIVLFDLEANHIFKYVGRKVMAHTESHHQLAAEQYGSRKRRRPSSTLSISTLAMTSSANLSTLGHSAPMMQNCAMIESSMR